MTGAALIPRALADRLAKLCGMFGSAHDGERANAARLADELIKSAGVTVDSRVRRRTQAWLRLRRMRVVGNWG